VLLYRNLVGAGFTYYHAGPDGFWFGGNLADLVEAAGAPRAPNRDALPTFFLYRFVPGRDTLFEGFHRLLPGELACWDGRGLTRTQRHSFAGLRETPPPAGDALDRVQETTQAVLADCAALDPGAANLLSGGVDSSYLQAVWNLVCPGDGLPPSYSVGVDHPRCWADSDYALTAAHALGSRHELVPADGPYTGYLIDALSTTGEPPNHVQSVYFLGLARAMAARGVRTGVCGEGADSLFGLGLATELHNAGLMRALVPTRGLRRAAAAAAGALGWAGVASALRRADGLSDFADLEHPVNRVAAFADWPSVRACFGAAAVAAAAAGRRALLDRLAVPDAPLDRLHAAGYLGEAADSASLWATLFHAAGADLLCPFLDSRMLRMAVNLPPAVRYRFRRPKDVLKRALDRLAPADLARRRKLGFGQPIFEWLAPGGQLRPLVERIDDHDFIDRDALADAKARPNWFLYSLLCYDLWHKLFIERTLPRPARPAPARRGQPGPVNHATVTQ
jgi:asparagine synthase (glutamine-hydrolysing)